MVFPFFFYSIFFFFLSGMVTSGIQVSLCISDFGHQALFFFSIGSEDACI